ncbi:MAG: hypothetical protein V3T54_00335 [Acidobacteriota bacterium]
MSETMEAEVKMQISLPREAWNRAAEWAQREYGSPYTFPKIRADVDPQTGGLDFVVCTYNKDMEAVERPLSDFLDKPKDPPVGNLSVMDKPKPRPTKMGTIGP